MTRKRKILFILITWLLLILLGGGIELVCRQFLPYPPTTLPTYRTDRDYMYFHRPDSVGWQISEFDEYPPVLLQYNEHGFRGESFPVQKPKGEVRIVLLGDSFVEARQVEEDKTMSRVLQQQIGRENVRVINAGCSAYTTTTEYLLLKHHIARFSPDVVIVLFAFNDYCDNYWYGQYCDYPNVFTNGLPEKCMPAAYAESSQAMRKSTLWEKICAHSAILSWLKYKSTQADARIHRLKVWKAVVETDQFHKSSLRVHKTNLSPEEKKVLDFTHQGVLEMKRLCQEQGIAFGLAIIPFPIQINASENSVGKKVWGYEPDQVMNETVYQERLKSFAKANAIPVLDLLPAFRKATPNKELFLNIDGHLAEEGNALIAKECLPFLKTFFKGKGI
ncbi:MAG: SGNH/GDSL hydrolase family protein [Phycisphaerae bacterium]|nr:SGNH/GDSL hydrolase family protein [Phycisphaerae bacterium]